jgi:flagellar assembly protein FliH
MAGIIKRGQPSRHGEAHVAFNYDDIAGKAQTYLNEVQSKAAQILADANAQAVAIREQASVAGLAAASQQAEAQVDTRVKQQLQSSVSALQQAAAELTVAKESLLAAWETQVVDLAVAIAARVIRTEIADKPQITIGLIQESLRLAADETQLMLQLNPADVAALGKEIDACLSDLGKVGKVEVVPVESVERGGCRLLTSSGEIDQRLETQLQRIESELTK